MTDRKNTKVIREAKIEDATLIVKVPKSEEGGMKKEIRHRLDSPSHSLELGELHWVDDDYNIAKVERNDFLETIITGLDCTIRMSTDISEHNVGATCRWVLDCSTDVIAVGGYKLKEHYRIEA
jgi:hypothetical protein